MTSCSKNDCSNYLADHFTRNFATMYPKRHKTEVRNLGPRVLVASLMARSKKPPPPTPTPPPQ